MLAVGLGNRGGRPRASRNTGSFSLAAGAILPESLDRLVVALPPLLYAGSSCVAPGPRFVLGMIKSSTGSNILTSPDLEKLKEAENKSRGKGPEIRERIAQWHQSVRGDRSRKGRWDHSDGSARHGARCGRKPRAGSEVPILAKGRRVGAAQVPARTHNVPTLASSPNANTPKECKWASQRKANQDKRPRGFPEKLPKNADILWAGLPYGP